MKNKYIFKFTWRWKLFCMGLSSIKYITIVVSRDSSEQKHIFQFTFLFCLFVFICHLHRARKLNKNQQITQGSIVPKCNDEGERERNQTQKNTHLGLYLYKVHKQAKLGYCQHIQHLCAKSQKAPFPPQMKGTRHGWWKGLSFSSCQYPHWPSTQGTIICAGSAASSNDLYETML